MTVAVASAADIVRTEPSITAGHLLRFTWALTAFNDPRGMAIRMQSSVIAQNQTLTKSQILSLNDAHLLTSIQNAINVFAGVI